MTQKEAIIEALNRLGGKASLSDIYQLAYKLADFSGSRDWKATIRCYLQKEPDLFRSSKRSWWELVSYQEEIAERDKEIARLKAEVEQLKGVPTEDDFVKRFVKETKHFFKHDRKKADTVRQIMIKVGRSDADRDLDVWIEHKENKLTDAVNKLAETPTVQIDVKAGAHAQISEQGITNQYPQLQNKQTK